MQLPKHSEGWFLLLFSIQFVIGLVLVVDYVGPDSRIWPDRIVEVLKLMPYVIVVGATTTTMAVEVVFMLAEQYLRRRFQEGKEEGLEEGKQQGRRELSEKVRAWNERRLEAERLGKKFNEPPPIDD
jgi:hypothetical protein